MVLITITLLLGIVAGLNLMAMIDTLNFRAALFRHGFGSRFFEGLALLGVVASILISIKLFKQSNVFSFLFSYLFWGGIGYSIGGLLMKSMLGGILPIIANVIIIILAAYL